MADGPRLPNACAGAPEPVAATLPIAHHAPHADRQPRGTHAPARNRVRLLILFSVLACAHAALMLPRDPVTPMRSAAEPRPSAVVVTLLQAPQSAELRPMPDTRPQPPAAPRTPRASTASHRSTRPTARPAPTHVPAAAPVRRPQPQSRRVAPETAKVAAEPAPQNATPRVAEHEDTLRTAHDAHQEPRAAQLDRSDASATPSTAQSVAPTASPSAHPAAAPSNAPPDAPTAPPDARTLGCVIPEPPYPRLARLAGETGTTVIRIASDAAGAIASASVVRSSGSQRLDAAALGAARTARCSTAVAAATVPFHFQLLP